MIVVATSNVILSIISRVNLESYVHFMESYVHCMRFARAKALESTRGLLKIFKECIGNARYIPKLFWLVAPLLLLELINKKHHVLWNRTFYLELEPDLE